MINSLRCGTGFDVHRFEEGRKLVLGGVEIAWEKGLAGHSDADVLTHAIMDALLGGSGLGDIGQLFPDNDPQYRGISSILLLSHVYKLLTTHNYRIINIDTTVMAQAPKVMPYSDKMRAVLSAALGDLEADRIGIKATTTEKCGFIGRGEAMAVQAAALLYKG